MKWKFIINDTPLGSVDPSGGYAPQKKEFLGYVLGGLSLASSIFGGAQAAEAQRKAEKMQAAEKAKNDAWYNRKYNEHTIDTAAGRNIMRIAREEARKNWKKAAGAAAVTGSTESSVAMQKEAGNRMIGDAIANIEAKDVARKDNIDATYRQRSSQLAQQDMILAQQRAENISRVASGVSNALMTGAMYAGGSSGKGGTRSGIAGSEKWQKNHVDEIYDMNKNFNSWHDDARGFMA